MNMAHKEKRSEKGITAMITAELLIPLSSSGTLLILCFFMEKSVENLKVVFE